MTVVGEPRSEPGKPQQPRPREASLGVIPKARGPEFTELVSLLAKEICVDGTPHCSACPLKADCPTGQDTLTKKPTEAKPKPKSR